jgi:hypothetical protein
MRKRYLLTLFVVVLVALASVTPVLAYTGVVGTVYDDSDNPQPWQHGGVVDIYGDAGSGIQLLTTCYLGTSSGIFGEIVADATAGGDCTYPASAPQDFTNVYVVIDPNAGTGGDPGDIQVDFLELPEEELKNLGYLKLENTGPNAVSLTGLAGTSGMALMSVLPLAAVAGLGAVKLNRKKQQ